MPGEPLTSEERVAIEVAAALGESCRTIGVMLGRPASTISREVNRNGGRDSYSSLRAESRASECRRRPKRTRFEADPALASHVAERVRAKDSPMTISLELARGLYPEVAGRVSHETIYRGIYAQGGTGLEAGLARHLHRRHRRRKPHRRPGEIPTGTGPLGDFSLLTKRPPEALGRCEVGHLEGDLILGSMNRSAIGTVFDRTSRYCWLVDFPFDHSADSTLMAMLELLARIPSQVRLTLTWDQGREMAEHAILADGAGIDIYFAHPHSPWERPTNENGNGLLRRYFPKSTDLSVYTKDNLRAVETRLNTMPRRTLDWETAQQRYDAAVALTA